MVSKVYYEVHMTCVLHTARISNVTFMLLDNSPLLFYSSYKVNYQTLWLVNYLIQANNFHNSDTITLTVWPIKSDVHLTFPHNINPKSNIEVTRIIACKLTLKSSWSVVRPAIFDLQLEWIVGVGGVGGEKNLHSPTPTPLLIHECQLPPWYKFIPLPSLLLPLKSKMAAKIFIMKLLSTRLPKLRLLCRLQE